MTKRIALTGATGFVGQNLLEELLSRGYQVNALTRKIQNPKTGVNWIPGDLQNIDALTKLLDGCDVLINVAGLIKAKSKEEFMSANAHAVATLKSIVNKSHLNPLFVQISSYAARERHLSDYAASKYQGEEMLKIGDQIRWTIIRPPAVYGPGDTETLKIFKVINNGIALYPSDKNNRVSWIHISDLCVAITDLVELENCEKKTFEVDDGADNGHSHEEFFEISSKLLSKTPIKLTAPRFFLKIIGWTNELFAVLLRYAPMVSSKKVNEICHSDWTLDQNLDFRNTGWKPKIKLKDGLKETLDWYRNNEYI